MSDVFSMAYQCSDDVVQLTSPADEDLGPTNSAAHGQHPCYSRQVSYINYLASFSHYFTFCMSQFRQLPSEAFRTVS